MKRITSGKVTDPKMEENIEQIFDKAIKESGVNIEPQLRAMMILICEAMLRQGYNKAVSDWEKGFSLKKQDLMFLKNFTQCK